MTRWRVELTKSARRELRHLEEGPQRDAAEMIEDLMEDPKLVPASEMRGYQNTWKARFYRDEYRMVYQIAKAQKLVRVIRIRPRPTAYEGMKQ